VADIYGTGTIVSEKIASFVITSSSSSPSSLLFFWLPRDASHKITMTMVRFAVIFSCLLTIFPSFDDNKVDFVAARPYLALSSRKTFKRSNSGGSSNGNCFGHSQRRRTVAIRSDTAALQQLLRGGRYREGNASISDGDAPVSTSSLVGLRGGGCRVDPASLACKLLIANGAVNGALSWLAPTAVLSQLYGDAPNRLDREIQSLVGRVGTTNMCIAILSYCTIFRGMETQRAIGYGCIPWCSSCLFGLLPNSRQANKNPAWILVVGATFQALVAYACLFGGDPDWADSAAILLAAGLACDFVMLGLFTRTTMDLVWTPKRRELTPSQSCVSYHRWLGVILGMYSVQMWSLLWGVKPARALANSVLVFLAFLGYDLASGTVRALTPENVSASKSTFVVLAAAALSIYACETAATPRGATA